MFFNRLNSLKSNSAHPGVCAGSVALLFCCNYQLSFLEIYWTETVNSPALSHATLLNETAIDSNSISPPPLPGSVLNQQVFRAGVEPIFLARKPHFLQWKCTEKGLRTVKGWKPVPEPCLWKKGVQGSLGNPKCPFYDIITAKKNEECAAKRILTLKLKRENED